MIGRNVMAALPLQQQAYLQGFVFLLLYVVTFAPAYTVFSGSSLRFIPYAVPMLNLALWFMFSPQQLRYDTRFLLALCMYSALLLLLLFISVDEFDRFTWFNALRPVLYLLMFVPFMQFNATSVRVLVVMVIIIMLLQAMLGNYTSAGGFSFLQSQGLLESGLAFPLGAMLLFCLRYRYYSMAGIVAILFLIAFKRIAIAGICLLLVLMSINWFVAKISSIKERYWAYATLVLFASCAVLLNLYYYSFFTFLAELAGVDQSALTLTMGRTSEFEILDMQTGNQSLLQILFGGGPGFATRHFLDVTITYPAQVHNSFLLYYYDFGVLGFAWFMASFLVIYSRNNFGLYVFAYNIFLMITDNSFTQHYQQVICFILVAAAQHIEQDRAQKQARLSQ